jgi:hypothetical protein
MNITRNYKKPFVQFVKKQHKAFKAVIEDEVNIICGNTEIGELKVGDLAGIRVHKFRFNKQEYLIAYFVDEDRALQFINIDFYKIGVHENFYEELKNYIRARG